MTTHALIASFCLLTGSLAAQLGSLTTTFVDNNGRSTAGCTVMMDVVVTNPAGLRLVGADLNLIATAPAPFEVTVWITPGGYSGNQLNPAVWTQISEGSGVAAGRGLPSAVDLRDFTLAPGTYGLAFHHLNSGVAYTNGTGTNQSYSNSDLTLNLGVATSAFFSGSQFNPRVWNGTLYYYNGNACYGVFGAGCPHAGGVPTLAPASGSVPSLGGQLNLSLGLLDPSGAPAFVAAGFDNTNTPLGPTPLSLGMFGAPGCSLLLDPVATGFVANIGGSGQFGMAIPNFAGLVGISLYHQGLVFAPGFNNLGAVVTNGGEGVIGL
jgi:hypothetical protein